MSYKRSASRKDRIAARFLAQVHAAIANAAVSAKLDDSVTQTMIAGELGVDKSVVSRILKGVGNPTIRTVGELSAALGYRPELILRKIETPTGANDLTFYQRGNGFGRRPRDPSTTANVERSKPTVVSFDNRNNLERTSQ